MGVSVRAFACGLLFSVLGAGASVAADIPRPVYKAAPALAPSFNWSGFYGGIHAGYGWTDRNVDVGIIDPSGVTQAVAADGGTPLSYSINRDGYVVGGQLGYNRQFNRWLAGWEIDLSATGFNGSSTVFTPTCPNFCGGPNTSTVSQDMDWFGTVRARFGYTEGPWLVYGTGGLAYGHVKYDYLLTNAPFGGPLTMSKSESHVEVGWTAGAGFEYGFGPWSAKLEYLYYDLGTRAVGVSNPLAPPALGVQLVPNYSNSGSIVRVGLNHKLNWFGLP